MTNDLDLKQILEFMRSRLRLIIFCGLVGATLALIFNTLSPKIYEAYFEFQLARVMLEDDSEVPKRLRWISVPQAVDARRILMSPMKISQSVVEDCGFQDTNQNRKNLINQIRINNLDSAGSELFVYVRLSGKEAVSKCAEAVQSIEIANSNSELKKYIEAASAAENKIKIVKIVPAISSGNIRISTDFIYPRIYLNLLAYISIAIFSGLFIEWLYLRLKSVFRD